MESVNLDDYFVFNNVDDIRIKGHRIGIEHVVDYYREGYSPEQIAQDFPGLHLETIYAVIAFYLHNKAEVDAYIKRVRDKQERDYQEWLRQPPSPERERLQALWAQVQQEYEHEAAVLA